MATAPTKQAISALYSQTLRTSKSFSSYNFRQYFVQKTEDSFKSMEAEQDSTKLSSMYNEAVKDLAVLKRGAIVNQLYGGWKLAVEDQSEVRERADN